MLGSEIDVGFKLPNTTAGWIVYITTKILVAIINILIFHCFQEQAKVNVKDIEEYKKANEILRVAKKKVKIPRSPHAWVTKQYLVKGVIIFLTSILSAFALTNAILTFNLTEMLTYIFTVVMGLIMGVISMKGAEHYWTIEYYEYALLIEKEEGEQQCLKSMENNIET